MRNRGDRALTSLFVKNGSPAKNWPDSASRCLKTAMVNICGISRKGEVIVQG
jgi:hypothetical protein